MERERHHLQLAGDLRVRSLAEVRSRLLSVESPDLDIDLSGVTEFDTAGLQLLLSLRKDLALRNGSLFVSRASEPVERLIAFFRAKELLDSVEVQNG